LKPVLRPISKEEASTLLQPYHYLTQESNGFRSGYNYGAFIDNELMAVCIFHNPSVPELVKGCFGLARNEQNGIFELGRLVKNPSANGTLILSQVVAMAIKELKKNTDVRAILSYADSRYHTGFIYQALNFKYYGMTAPKTDFWFEQEDGSFIKHVRGKVKGAKGEWRPRSRKHRYLMTYDKQLLSNWSEQPYPKQDNVEYVTTALA
tara:strand:- start:55 stop:675 length:621 start_codon:yes stop_codon:yes gene_type:complete